GGGILRPPLRHPDNLPVCRDGVHEAACRGDALLSRRAVDRDGQHEAGLVDSERDDGGLPEGDRAAADLAERGGHPDLVLVLEAEPGAQLAAEPPRGEHAGQVQDPQPGELVGHGLSTSTPASSRRDPAWASSAAPTSSGSLAFRPGSAAGSQRELMPSECRMIAAPGGALYSNCLMERA